MHVRTLEKALFGMIKIGERDRCFLTPNTACKAGDLYPRVGQDRAGLEGCQVTKRRHVE